MPPPLKTLHPRSQGGYCPQAGFCLLQPSSLPCPRDSQPRWEQITMLVKPQASLLSRVTVDVRTVQDSATGRERSACQLPTSNRPLKSVHISNDPSAGLCTEETSMLVGLPTPVHFSSSSAALLPLQLTQCHNRKWWQKRKDRKGCISGPERISYQQPQELSFLWGD